MIEVGDVVRIRGPEPGQHGPEIGTVTEVFPAPHTWTDDAWVAAVRVGPNPHEVRHYRTEYLERVL